MSIFSKRLKLLRDERNESQLKIAQSLGISPQAFSYYVKGREPNYDTLIKIAEYFDTTVDYLIGKTNNRKAENVPLGTALGLSDSAIGIIQASYQSEKYLNAKDPISQHKILDALLSNGCFSVLLEDFQIYLTSKITAYNSSDDLPEKIPHGDLGHGYIVLSGFHMTEFFRSKVYAAFNQLFAETETELLSSITASNKDM